MAVGIWKAFGTWPDRARELDRALRGIRDGIARLGDERFGEVLHELKGNAGWPKHQPDTRGVWPTTGWPAADVVRTFIDNIAGPVPAAQEA